MSAESHVPPGGVLARPRRRERSGSAAPAAGVVPAKDEPVSRDVEPRVPTTLWRGTPLVPSDDAASRALAAVIAVLTFLAGLAAGGAEIVAASSRDWRAEISREATIQIRPAPTRDIEADVARATEIARQRPGIASVRTVSKSESEDLLAPWLGRGLDLAELPVPRLIVLALNPRAPPDLTGLAAALDREVPGARVDNHGQWISRLTTMANTIVVVAIGLVALVLAAGGAAVAFATRGAMAGNREVVEVLHFVGAGDRFIARQFQGRFLRLGLRGGAIGAAGACLFVLACGLASNAAAAGPSAIALESMFGSFSMGWPGYALIAAIPLLVAGIAGLVSGRVVRRYLSES